MSETINFTTSLKLHVKSLHKEIAIDHNIEELFDGESGAGRIEEG